MRTLYSFLLYCLIPVVLLRLLWRSLQAPDYRKRWAERFGFFPGPEPRHAIWIHAVSVGESLAAIPLIRALQQKYPQHDLVVTTMTPTGSARVRENLGDDVFHVYIPYDLPSAVRRFLDKIRPELVIVMETEVWPNLFHACEHRKIPVILANARMSERSARGYSRFPKLTRSTLGCLRVIAAQSKSDAQRFEDLGADAKQLQVTGSVKFDFEIPASVREQAEVLRRRLGIDRPIWIAASTHEGEEEQVLDALAQVSQSIPNVLLLLVPRHPERFARVVALCKKRGLGLAQHSLGESCKAGTRVYLGDTMGELPLMYAASDVAFVGGSLVAVGGHNLLEPAALQVPSIVGPHVFNFAEITRSLVEHEGAIQVQDVAQLAANVERLMRDPARRHQIGQNAYAFVEQNRGSLGRLFKLIEDVYPAR